MDRKSIVAFVSLLSLFSFLALKNTDFVSAFSSTIVISEIQIAGTTAKDEFIELHNLTNDDINLGDYRLVRRTESGTTDSSIKAFGISDIIPANGYYLWTGDEWTGSVIPDSSTSGVLANNNSIALKLEGDVDQVIDSVGWGTASNDYVEGTVFTTNPAAGQSIQRIGQDTDDNSADFILSESPDPQNTQSEVSTSSPSATPSVEPTPSEESSPTLSPTPSIEVTPTVTATTSAEPSSSPSPSPTAVVTSTPSSTPHVHSRVLARFWGTRNRIRECRLEYHNFGYFRFPRITCEWITLG